MKRTLLYFVCIITLFVLSGCSASKETSNNIFNDLKKIK